MKELKVKQRLGLCVALLMLLLGVSIGNNGLTHVKAEDKSIEIASAISGYRAGYDTFYYEEGVNYTLNGNAVTFKDAGTITVNGVDQVLKNAKTAVDVTVEGQQAIIKFQDLVRPVGSISGAWNAIYGGKTYVRYTSDIPGKETVEGSDLKTITLAGLANGTYHLSGGQIYEEANEWSPGYDFGDGKGKVTSGRFGTLPDITVTVGNSGGNTEDEGITIPESAFNQNKYNERYYYQENETYFYKGNAVTFKDEATIVAGGEEKALRNRAVRISVNTDVQKGEAAISFDSLYPPVGYVASLWNPSRGGGVQVVYKTDIVDGQEIRTTLEDGYSNLNPLKNTLKLSGLSAGRSYHLTEGTLYETANPWSPGIDFGNGTVTSGTFGILPDITFTMETSEGAETAVIAQIGNLPPLEALGLENRDDVDAARSAFNALSPEQQKRVSNLNVLEACEAKIETLLKGRYKDGTYEGSAQGRNGEIKLQIVVKAGEITEIKEVGQNETESFWNQAKILFDNIISRQDTDVDTISGATISSKGIIGAVRDALSKDPVITDPGEVQENYLGVKTEPRVYDDFQNDLWLQFQQKDLTLGATTVLYPWRVDQAVTDFINNNVERPSFNFEIISGESITLDTFKTNDRATVTAVKPGTSVIKVTYDAFTHSAGQVFGAISPINTGYAVITVGETGEAVIKTDDSFTNWRHYDTIYYDKGETTPYTLSVETEKAQNVKVTCNGIAVDGQGTTYTLPLENRSNIIGIEATDANGNVKSMYRIIDARFVRVNINNSTNPDKPLQAGDTANISLTGITMPVYKLATIYNPCFSSPWGGEPTQIQYNEENLGSFTGKCRQWDLATNNDFDVTFENAGTYKFKGQGINSHWWGSPLGTDQVVFGQGEPGMGSPEMQGVFSTLPDFEVEVKAGSAVTGLAIDPAHKNISIGEKTSLTAKVTPADASLTNLVWTSSDKTVATVDSKGVVTGIAEGRATIEATLGKIKAQSVITVKKIGVESVTLSETKVEMSANTSVALKATVLPENATNPAITWKSSDETIAVVDDNGKVTAKQDGTAIITATADGISTNCEITVTKVPVTDIIVNPESINIEVGRTEIISVTVKPDTASNKTLAWSSTNSDIAGVTGNGKVIARSEGKATITVNTADGISKNIEVTVTAGKTPATTALITPEAIYSGMAVSVALPELTKPEKVGEQTVWEKYTYYESSIPGVQSVQSDDINTLKFNIGAEVKPGIYYLSDGYLYYDYGGMRVQGVLIIGNTQEAFHQGEMPVIAITVRERDEAAQSVFDAINVIGNVTDLSQGDAIRSARAAYDALTETHKVQITNLSTLLAAEQKLSDLQYKEAQVTLNALPEDAQSLRIEDGAMVEAARKAVDSLTDAQKNEEEIKALLPRLDACEARMTVLKAEKGDPIGTVTVSIEDMVETPEGENWPAARGMLLEAQTISIYRDDSMMSAIERACYLNELHITINSGAYISEIDNLSEFDRGNGSGWMGTLNGWFTNQGFNQYKASDGTFGDGDVIAVRYTTNYGMDLTDTTASDAIEDLGLSQGTLSPALDRETQNYTLTLPEGAESVSLTPKMLNQFNRIQIFEGGNEQKLGREIPVKTGTIIEIKVTPGEGLMGRSASVSDPYSIYLTVRGIAPALDRVVDLIDALGTIDSLEKAQDVEAARKAYDQLTAEQKAQVENIDVLKAAEEKIDALQLEKAKEDGIAQLKAYHKTLDLKNKDLEKANIILEEALTKIQAVQGKASEAQKTIDNIVTEAKAQMDKIKLESDKGDDVSPPAGGNGDKTDASKGNQPGTGSQTTSNSSTGINGESTVMIIGVCLLMVATATTLFVMRKKYIQKKK